MDLNSNDSRAGNASTGLVPTPLLADYLKLGFLLLSMIFGLGFNTLALKRLVPAYRKQRRTQQKSLKAAFTLLKIHLTFSNLAVLSFYNAAHVAWLYTYQWLGGDVLCRVTHFLFVLAFQSMSNVVTAIAVDRLRNVHRLTSSNHQDLTNPDAVRFVKSMSNVVTAIAVDRLRNVHRLTSSNHQDLTNPDAVRFVKILLASSWGTAILFSAPQLYFWGTAEVEPGWWQCMSYWDQERLQRMHSLEAQGASRDQITATFDEKIPSVERAYGLLHLVCVFWVPMLVSLACYVVVFSLLVKLSRTSFHQPEEINGNISLPRKSLSSPHINARNEENRDHSSYKMLRMNSQSPMPNSPPKFGSEADNGTVNEPLLPHPTSPPPYQTGNTYTSQQKSARVGSPGPVPVWRGRPKRRLLKTASFIMLAYLVSWTPYNILSLIVMGDPGGSQQISANLDWVKALIILNALLNPVLYSK